MENELFELVIRGFHQNYLNQWSDNYDEYRYGRRSKSVKRKLIIFVHRIIRSFLFRTGQKKVIDNNISRLAPYFTGYNDLFIHLNDQKSKNLLKDLLLFKILGNERYKLPLSNELHFQRIKDIERRSDKKKIINPEFLHFKLFLHDLSFLGRKIKLYHTESAIYRDFVLEQYAYSNEQIQIRAEKGDVVIDAGACWGDTPLYFADLVGLDGKVYAFEFITTNLDIFYKNLKLNPELSKIIKVVNRPLHEFTDKEMYVMENGPASRIVLENPTNEKCETLKTLSIDDFVVQNNIDRIDMIKMDIEGAEPSALKGAIKTLKRDIPKLAISIYHSENDFTEIYKWIDSLNLGYKFYLDHFTIYRGETILFCTTS